MLLREFLAPFLLLSFNSYLVTPSGDSYSVSGEDTSGFGPTWVCFFRGISGPNSDFDRVDHLPLVLKNRKGCRWEIQRLDNFAFPGASAEEDLHLQLSRFLDQSAPKNANVFTNLNPSRTLYGEWLI